MLQFLSTKAYGDFVIALTSLERAGTANASILAGTHLMPLADALTPSVRIDTFDHGAGGVPALFDVRNAGIKAAVTSALAVRAGVHRGRRTGATLVLDRAGPRERFAAWPGQTLALPRKANIYDAYDSLLAERRTRPAPPRPHDSRPTAAAVGIFPGSRLPAKNLPVDLVRTIVTTVHGLGLKPHLWLLEGERPDLEASTLPYRIIPRSFGALRAAIGEMARVISADSLPAHLAERALIPAFVVSPQPNTYWLPKSSFEKGRWSVFADNVSTSLSQFIEGQDA